MENWRTGPRSGCWEISAAIESHYDNPDAFLQPHLNEAIPLP
jgi:hypothetical protein